MMIHDLILFNLIFRYCTVSPQTFDLIEIKIIELNRAVFIKLIFHFMMSSSLFDLSCRLISFHPDVVVVNFILEYLFIYCCCNCCYCCCCWYYYLYYCHYYYCYYYCCWFGMYVRTNSTIDCLFSINAIINLSRCTYRNCTILASTPSLSMSLISSSLNKSFIFSGGKNKWKNGVLKLVKREINKTLVKLSQIKSAKIILSQVMRTK